jgi:hypothetical protein
MNAAMRRLAAAHGCGAAHMPPGAAADAPS